MAIADTTHRARQHGPLRVPRGPRGPKRVTGWMTDQGDWGAGDRPHHMKGQDRTMKTEMIGSYAVVRTVNAGVFAGTISERDGDEIVLTDARRIWYWDGAASLSELAVRGVSKPESCKFPCAVPVIALLGVIEIIPATAAARESIEGVPEWTSH